ncbi:hypothetical protein NQZ68_004912 [Dissostichus eleginoides]|nr:hypothetical protein NQZ68_004912 [Dissostichus eleginoides]
MAMEWKEVDGGKSECKQRRHVKKATGSLAETNSTCAQSHNLRIKVQDLTAIVP